MECVEFEEAGFHCVPSHHCSESGIIKANFSGQFQSRCWSNIYLSSQLCFTWNACPVPMYKIKNFSTNKIHFFWRQWRHHNFQFQILWGELQFWQQHRLWTWGVLSSWQVAVDMTLLVIMAMIYDMWYMKPNNPTPRNALSVRHVFYPIRMCNGSTTLDLGTGVDGGVGQTAWGPEGREGRYQAGPKGCNLEVGARRAPRLLVV